ASGRDHFSGEPNNPRRPMLRSSPASPFTVVRRRDLVRPVDRNEARTLTAQLTPGATALERAALEDDILAGRVLVARRNDDRRCDDPPEAPLLSAATR
ncbi:MAG: hypothetical protein KUG77_18330, partial [Nannocystaceae bacterium]|nr:hypothetical protein [Nannocystaceae bacterium]